MERTRKASWGFLSGLAFAGITVILGLAATPLLLQWLGPERFGAFRAASDWTGHLTIFELGLSWALIPLFARALGKGDRFAVRAILRAGVRIYLGVALLMLAAGAGLALVMLRLVPVSATLAHDLKTASWVALFAVFVVPLSPFRALAEADQRSYLINILLIVQAATVTGLAVLFAALGWGITGQFLAASIGLFPPFLILMRDGLRRHSVVSRQWAVVRSLPAGKDHQQTSDRDQLYADCLVGPSATNHGLRAPDYASIRREIWTMNWPSLIRNMCGRIGLYTDNLLIAYFLGPAVVASFYLTQRTLVLAQSQLLGIGSSGWAGLVELFHRGHIGTFHRRLIELTGLVTVLGIAVMVPLVAFNRNFISLWVGPSCYGGEWITGLAAANGILLSIFSLWGLVISGAGHVARVVPGMVSSAAVNIVVSITATIFLGPPGPLLGTLTALVTVNSWFLPILLKRLFRVPFWPLFRAIALPVLIGIPYALGIRWFAHGHPPERWIPLALDMAGSALFYLVITWLAIFKAEERAVWTYRLRMLLRPRVAA